MAFDGFAGVADKHGVTRWTHYAIRCLKHCRARLADGSGGGNR